MYHHKWSNLTISGIMLGELILNHTDNLSRTLQKTNIFAAQGQSVVQLTVTTLQMIKVLSCFGRKLKFARHFRP